jgi:hypothetical protein
MSSAFVVAASGVEGTTVAGFSATTMVSSFATITSVTGSG